MFYVSGNDVLSINFVYFFVYVFMNNDGINKLLGMVMLNVSVIIMR